MQAFNAICKYLHKNTASVLMRISQDIKEKTMEIVLRVNQALYVVCTDGTRFISPCGDCLYQCNANTYNVSFEEVKDAVLRACGYAVYAHDDELKRGFVSLDKGNRMAITGNLGTVYDAPSDLSYISSVRLRIARNIKMRTDFVFESNRICSTLIIGPPASGKTTVLRSIAENLSSGHYNQFFRTAVVDERNEIFPKGLIQSPCADVLSGVQKAIGINTALRLCSPQVIICDEIGSPEEADAILDSLNSGVKFICSMHARTKEELFCKKCFRVLHERYVFERLIFLDPLSVPGTISEIVDIQELTQCEACC